jgi:hypothetical protein
VIEERHAEQQEFVGIVDRIDPNELAEQVVANFRTEIPAYRRLSPNAEQKVLETVRSHCELALHLLREGRDITDEDLEGPRRAARADARAGIPLEDAVRAYQVGGLVGWRTFRAVSKPHESAAATLGTERFLSFVERVSAAVSAAYMEEGERLGLPEERRWRALLDALCENRPIDADLKTLAAQLGFPLDQSYRLFAAFGVESAESGPTLSSYLRSQGLLPAFEGDLVIGLAPADFNRKDALATRSEVFALFEPVARNELADGLIQVRQLVEIARTLGRSGEVSEGDLLLERLLAGSPRLAAQLQRLVLSPLDRRDDGHDAGLSKTLEVFVTNALERKTTAGLLHVHPNTLDYRLKQIKELTGIDLHQPDDLAMVALALKLSSVKGGD